MHLTRKIRHLPRDLGHVRPAMVGVQGPNLTDPEALADLGRIPGHERVVLIPRDLLMGYLKEHP